MPGCSHLPTPPKAKEISHRLEAHGEVRDDLFFWLRDRENPEVLNYLNEENAFLESALAPVKGLREKLVAEMRARIKQDDSSVPVYRHGYFYYQRFELNREYPIYARKKGSLEAAEEILLDVNELAQGHAFTSVLFPDMSVDQNKMVYAADFVGRRFYTLYVKDLRTGKLIGNPIPNTTGNVEWANDNQTFFYAKQNPETLRSQWIYRHELGVASDTLVLEEPDETFTIEVAKSRTEAFLFFVSNSTLSTEWRTLSAARPKDKPQVYLPRESEHEYFLEDGGEAFYIVSNWQAKNFRLLKAPHSSSEKEKWVEVLPHRSDVLLENATFFRSHYVLSERFSGQTRLTVVNRGSGASLEIPFPDPVQMANLEGNSRFDASAVRYRYQSLNKPDSIFDFDFQSEKSELKKQQEVPSFDASKYVSERLWATARDGTRIPISLLFKKGFKRDGKAPLLQYGYGSYGYSMEPSFSSDIFSLIDRGFAYAVAHVRGGAEMGRHWYEDGRLLNKMNSFTDFIDVSDFLVKEKIADPKRLYAQGASAGGLLMGAVMNLRPELYRGVNAGVPFVDVLTTMLDESIPLTTSEYDEWGDPRKREFYQYMRSYSPYDNVAPRAYPNVLIVSGLHDSQVQYWEPTKWAAKLRKLNSANSKILLFTEMDAGHGGASGRFESLKQIALEYAFFLFLEGVGE